MSFSGIEMTRLVFILFLLLNLSQGSLETDLAGISTFPYIENVWDCSEMSFYLQHELEDRGYNAQVAQRIGSPGHSWVIVVTETQIITVEATTMQIVPFRSDFNRILRNATDAINHGVPEDDVDWWNYHEIN
jgi:hypothetical protein